MTTKQIFSESNSIKRDEALNYHQETKHFFNAYAKSLGRLDWATQPNPFRKFDLTTKLQLSLPPVEAENNIKEHYHSYSNLWRSSNQLLQATPAPVNQQTISEFLYYSVALSAWKKYGESSWSLRVNPSSGNLHPTETYMVLPEIEGFTDAGVFHYVPETHILEKRCEIPTSSLQDLISKGQLPHGIFLVGLSSISWRESWKYGERAFRYCLHDTGHALAALRVSAATLGWRVYLLDLSDSIISKLFGISRQNDFPHGDELETPELCAIVIPNLKWDIAAQVGMNEYGIREIEGGKWHGVANLLSSGHHPWPIIDKVKQATEKITNGDIIIPSTLDIKSRDHLFANMATLPTRKIVRQRRSAVSFDGTTSITRDQFYEIISNTVPHLSMLFDVFPYQPAVHLGIFVHRVEGLPQGLYLLIRSNDKTKIEDIKSKFYHDKVKYLWKEPEGLPDHLKGSLYFLYQDNVTKIAAAVSCNQDIAGDSSFSLGMISEFKSRLKDDPHNYRKIFWEAGFIGQILYLEAEAHGVRGTGIGCYFDDAVHSIFGIHGNDYQSLYHFTIGGPVEDKRLRTLRAYEMNE